MKPRKKMTAEEKVIRLRENAKRYRLRNPLKAAEAAKRYRLRHPERVKANRVKSQRRYTLKMNFNITSEYYNNLLAAQNGRCAICGAIPEGFDTYRKGKSLAVDHDHRCCPKGTSCGKCIRGLLCDLCNRALGQFQDSPAILRKAAAYVEKYLEQSVSSKRISEDQPETLQESVKNAEGYPFQ